MVIKDKNTGGTPLDIIIRQKFCYGKDYYYPICDRALLFAHLCRTTTLTKDSLRTIIKLGYKIDFDKTGLNLNDLK